MAISKTYILPNGVPVGYHRIEELAVVSHARCHVLVKSYIDQASRQREIQRWEETRQPPYETTIPEQYSYMREIDMPFAGELNIEAAYTYLKTLPEFEGAVDVLDDSDTDVAPGFYEQAQAALAGAKTLAELTKTVNALMEYQGLQVRDLGGGVLEVVKKEAADMPSGDYLNPIPFVAPMTVTVGLFYTDGEDIWECIEGGMATSFTAPWFEVIG